MFRASSGTTRMSQSLNRQRSHPFTDGVILFRFSWKWRRRSPIKLMERTHEEATEAIRAGRGGRHPEAALAGEGAHLEVVRRSGTPADSLLPLAEGILRERGCGLRAETAKQPFR